MAEAKTAPVRLVHKGRGAVSSPQGRYERQLREGFDDGWIGDGADDGAAAPDTVVMPDASRSVISRNT